MPKYLDTRGRRLLSIGICARCSFKFPLEELRPDINFPGLFVCYKDADLKDPWQIPARATEVITIRNARPDIDISIPGVPPDLSSRGN